MPEQPSIGRRMGIAALIVSGGILLSRLLGFVREMVLAGVLGATQTSDEYFVAFLIPDFMNYLLAGGFLSITFIPIFTRYLAKEDEGGGWEAFTAVARPLVIAVTVLTGIAMISAEPLIRLVEPGFSEDQVLRAARITRIILPAQIFFVTGSLFMAVQYAKEKFLIPSLAPVVYNLGIITGGTVLGFGLDLGAEGFAWGVLGGAFVGNFLIQLWGARRAGMRWVANVPWLHPAVREYLGLAIPLMLGQSVVVLDEQLGRTFGSLAEDGAISWLNYARRAMLVPAGVIAQAAGVAAYPFLARLAEDGKIKELAATLGNALRYVVFLSLLAVAALGVLAEPAIRIAFQRGAYEYTDTLNTAAALLFYGFGVPFWGIAQVITRGFYARRQMWTPVIVGTLGTVVAIPIYYGLLQQMGYTGLALASTIALFLYTTTLTVIWYARTGTEPLNGVLVAFLRGSIAAGIGAGAAIGAGLLVRGVFPAGSVAEAAATLSAGGIAMLTAWVTAGLLLRAPELRDVGSRLLKRLKR